MSDSLLFFTAWQTDSRDNMIFPTVGYKIAISADITAPVISYALGYPDRIKSGVEGINLEECDNLNKTITFDDAIQKNLKVMDATAFTLCRDQKLPIGVIDIFKENALKNILIGSEEGTLVNI